jgi:alanine racemase
MTTDIARRDAWIEVDPGAIVANAAALRSLLPAGTGLMAVLKANAYGHGSSEVASALAGSADAFGVATLDEGLALREAGIGGRIVILYDVPAGAAAEGVAADIELSVGSLEALEEAAALRDGRRPVIHLKVDTGMTRQGIRLEQIDAWAEPLSRAAPLIAAVWTHLRDGADPAARSAQHEEFARAQTALARLGIHGGRHVSASAAILAGAVGDEELVRPGLALFGALPDEFLASGAESPVALRPAMAIRARPLRVAEVPGGTPVGYGGTFVTAAPSRLATLPLGYADGVPRSLSNGRGQVLIRGRRAPIVGRVSMDSLVVDVSDIGDVSRADVATLLGRDGREAITLEEMAAAAGTIPQELAVRLNSRLPRRYRRT